MEGGVSYYRLLCRELARRRSARPSPCPIVLHGTTTLPSASIRIRRFASLQNVARDALAVRCRWPLRVV
jgi:hypothetical protein